MVTQELPDIYITKKAWEQIYEALRWDLKHEVQFFGRGAYLDQLPEGEEPRGNYVLYEIIIPPQEVTGAFTDTGEGKANVDNLNFIIMEAMRLNLPISGWNFWGHTHPGMSTRPSSVDHENMLMWAEQWGRAIGAVFNEKNEITAWGAGPHPIFKGMQCEIDTDLKVTYERSRDEELYSQVAEWMTKNVKLEKPKVYSGASGGNYTGTKYLGSSNYKPKSQEEVRALMVQWWTDVGKVVNDDTEPDDVALSTQDWNKLNNMYDEAEVNIIWAKYEADGWVGLTPWERGAVLLELDAASMGYEGNSKPTSLADMTDEEIMAELAMEGVE